jgi:hypothetical protein
MYSRTDIPSGISMLMLLLLKRTGTVLARQLGGNARANVSVDTHAAFPRRFHQSAFDLFAQLKLHHGRLLKKRIRRN